MDLKEVISEEEKEKNAAALGFADGLADIPVFRFFLNSGSVGKLVGKIVLLLLVPYAFVWIAGVLLELVFHVYTNGAALAVAVIMLLLAVLCYIVLIPIAIVRFVKAKKKRA